jgi:hypothetical protein
VKRLLLWTILPLAAQDPEFNRDVRPILSDKCFVCHGPDAKNKNIALRLDVEAQAKADLGGGRRAILPGDPSNSELVKRITAERPARRMPPASTGHTLTAAEVSILQRWIQQGAQWQPHWAFLPPKAVADRSIDRWILARLEREKLKPSPEAAPEVLLRRVTLDLWGLPPTPGEVAAFLKDRDYEKAVDRLLASPRYAERMAIRWLDAARYADTNGYQYDGERVMWRWRDWVIDAFHQNKPYNQFIVEQIAGDLLPHATLDQKIATGFNRNHRGNTEDGIIPEEYAVEYVADRVETTSTVFLGLTLGCARCHNHKYDPLLQKDFYSVFAYFNNLPENGRAMKYGNSPPLIAAPTRRQQAELQDIDNRIAVERRKLLSILAREPLQFPAARWTPRSGLDTRWLAGQPVELEKAAPYDIRDSFSLAVRVTGGADGPLITKMANHAEGKGFAVYARQGKLHFHITSNFADDAIRIDTKESVLKPDLSQLIVATYDGTVAAAGVALYVDGKRVEVDVNRDTLYRPFVNAGATFKQPLRIGLGGGNGLKFDGTISEALVYSRVLDADELSALNGSPSFARNEFLETDDSTAGRAFRDLQATLRRRDLLQRSFPSVMIMAERGGPRRETHLLLRGAYDKPGEKVEPGVPQALPPLPPDAPNNRLGFAQWLVDPANPLTARVAVNRFWQMLFGTGIVKTVEDFGLQGDAPSHPELLDSLAVDFRESGWNVKALLKKMVMSATYRQSSAASLDLLARDPDNRLLARGPRHRLNAEVIRDQALAAAGLLREKVGGPSVKPYQPDGLWKDQIMQDMYYVQGKGEDLYRRSLYTFWKRTVAPPMMANFDAAGREACVVRESRTNTPLQALNLMNDVTFLEAARFIGQRMLLEGGDDRLGFGFRLVTGRAPDSREREVLNNAVSYHLDYFATHSADAYLKQGDSPRDPSLKPAEHAAYTAIASLLLNLDEAVTKQ